MIEGFKDFSVVQKSSKYLLAVTIIWYAEQHKQLP